MILLRVSLKNLRALILRILSIQVNIYYVSYYELSINYFNSYEENFGYPKWWFWVILMPENEVSSDFTSFLDVPNNCNLRLKKLSKFFGLKI